MKSIECKETGILEGERLLTYSDLIVISVRQPKQGGFGLEEMRLKIKVLDKLEDKKIGDIIDFEDAEIAVVKSAVSDMKWMGLHKDIVDFCDYINKI